MVISHSILEECFDAHKNRILRGRAAATHATTIEGLRIALQAGTDNIQHPELLTPREIPEELVHMIVEKNASCSMLVSTITGDAWTKHGTLETGKLADLLVLDADPLTDIHNIRKLNV